MPKRTSPGDAEHITLADDLQHLVQDKREGWRANAAKARRRQRHYNKLLTQQLIRLGPQATDDDDDPGGAFTNGE